QGPTNTADKMPIKPAPTKVPPRWFSLTVCKRSRSQVGSCNSYKPNIAAASSTKMPANTKITAGCCNTACKLAPANAANTPITAYVSAIGTTYATDSKKACPRLRLSLPTTKLDSTGNIGSTQGVKINNKPKPKKAANAQAKLPSCRALAKR